MDYSGYIKSYTKDEVLTSLVNNLAWAVSENRLFACFEDANGNQTQDQIEYVGNEPPKCGAFDVTLHGHTFTVTVTNKETPR